MKYVRGEQECWREKKKEEKVRNTRSRRGIDDGYDDEKRGTFEDR
jgi:hypothetical protein